MKNIVILGSTGSIGTSALDVIARLGPDYRVIALSANNNTDLFLKQLHSFKPRFAAVLNPASYEKIKDQMPEGTRLLPPEIDSLMFMASLPTADLIVSGVVGAVGFQPLVSAIKAGKTIALANKEPMVMAGKTLMKECERWEAAILPVDSEPSAIFQCLSGMADAHGYSKLEPQISRVFLTASGGPFAKRKGALSTVTPGEALNHPRWRMGKKITIDSATLMNKGFESIEIMNLFNLPEEKVQIVIHPQSIVHSAVEFNDGAILAQLGEPDMRVPIQYAITYPKRAPGPVKKLNLFETAKLEFFAPDLDRFPCLDLALAAARKGGLLPAVLSAADEVAVDAFLKEEIKFTDIAKLVYTVLKAAPQTQADATLNQALEADRWAREAAAACLKEKAYKKAVI
ncbi:1-deoxy-D-xylulose-5-phosphate reductoisomerase [Candidatus Avelusimicrobium gallicola]|uniref:1-deoxy-D-xylulose 5-phosphate reductoisomerase n=1 Tax=Candidatus Avelusimicrobium gallicola TaxID=2562704 RepID=A0A1Y4DCR2_9BACT|nr:1-deoxy-D-xylulose-5-phosphate reductoisomerase [Elusimicrobium sp. An273]OUO56897.1 1-deoxy-D-xylulose-5-phosphate reductoisomerase [Elusimicrobium sp. An273]